MSQAKVLVVEDDPTLREALCDTLELAGYAVRHAAEGRQALKLLAAESIAMVVSDVQMKPMDCFELLENMRKRFASIPVILMTAFATVETAVDAMKHGAYDFVEKPFTSAVTLKTVGKALEKQQLKKAQQELKKLAEKHGYRVEFGMKGNAIFLVEAGNRWYVAYESC